MNVRSTLAKWPAVRIRVSVFAVCASAIALTIMACSETGTSPSAPFAIEFTPFPAPAIVLGDSLRDVNGVATPLRAVVRNLGGEIIGDAPVRFVYADASRDTALKVDSISGFVLAQKPLSNGTTTATGTPIARLVARIGNNLQVTRNILVTTRPDSADRNGAPAVELLGVALPDSSEGNARNTSVSLPVSVRHIEGATVTAVPNWLVLYEVQRPANATNDATRSAYMVDELGRPSKIDTTDASGGVARYVRVRPSLFPDAGTVDSVIVLATVRYKGQNVKGSPIRIAVPVKKP